MLLRIRDEIKMTIAAYQTLYLSSVTFAMRKQLQAEYGKADLDRRIEEYEQRKLQQEAKIIELKSKIEAIEKRDQERRDIEAKKRSDEVNAVKVQEGHLYRFLRDLNKEQK